MLPNEEVLWAGLGSVTHASTLDYHLPFDVLRPAGDIDTTSAIHRLCDFLDAKDDLRKALYAGRVQAGIINEHGEYMSIDRHWWAAEQAEEVLLTGAAWVTKSRVTEVCRFILVREDQVREFAGSGNSADVNGVPKFQESSETASEKELSSAKWPTLSGLPGRPNARHLYVAEAARRIASGNYPTSLAQFARDLADWLGTDHPEQPPSGAKAIENAIRGLWNSREAAPKHSPRMK